MNHAKSHPIEEDIAWSDVLFVEGPEPIITYRTGWVVYEESLTGGSRRARLERRRLRQLLRRPARPARASHAAGVLAGDRRPAAGLGLGVGRAREDARTGRAAPHAVVTLRARRAPGHREGAHAARRHARPHPLAGGDQHRRPRRRRWRRPAPWSGVLQKTTALASAPARRGQPAVLGRLLRQHALGRRGRFPLARPARRPVTAIDGRYRRDRHRHPLFVLRNNATGEHFIGQLAWSGGYSFEFDLDADAGRPDGDRRALFFRAGPDAPAPQRIIAPGETVAHARDAPGPGLRRPRRGHPGHARPPAARASSCRSRAAAAAGSRVGHRPGDRDHARAGHPRHRGRRPSSAPRSSSSTQAGMRRRAATGGRTVGDWQVDRQRFPEGLEAVPRPRARARACSGGCGWTPSASAAKSRIAQEHPEWLARGLRRREATGRPARPDATRGGAVDGRRRSRRVIAENELEFFRLDYNTAARGRAIRTLRDGYVENGYWRYYEALYGDLRPPARALPRRDLRELRRRRRPHATSAWCAASATPG